ncbi:MAG: histidine kinase [Bacteroidota bacterium]
MRKIFIHNPFFRLITPVFYGVLVYVLILLINNNLEQLGSTFMNQEVYICIVLVYTLSETLRWNAIFNERFFKNNIQSQILWQLLTGIGLSLLVVTIIISAYFKWVYDFSIAESQLIIFNAIYAVSSLLYNLMYFSNVYIEKQNTQLLESENLRTEALESELLQFKNEVNPQLLYESLETLITLIHRNVEEGEDYIDHLSSVYRYILSHRKVELSTLEQEVNAAKNVVHLLNYQFAGRIKLESKISVTHSDTPIVPGTFPNLIEMIVRSNIINEYQPLEITIQPDESQTDYLVVQYHLNEKLIKDDRTTATFESIQKSYSFFSDKPVVSVKAYDFAYIKIPLLEEIQESIVESY